MGMVQDGRVRQVIAVTVMMGGLLACALALADSKKAVDASTHDSKGPSDGGTQSAVDIHPTPAPYAKREGTFGYFFSKPKGTALRTKQPRRSEEKGEAKTQVNAGEKLLLLGPTPSPGLPDRWVRVAPVLPTGDAEFARSGWVFYDNAAARTAAPTKSDEIKNLRGVLAKCQEDVKAVCGSRQSLASKLACLSDASYEELTPGCREQFGQTPTQKEAPEAVHSHGAAGGHGEPAHGEKKSGH